MTDCTPGHARGSKPMITPVAGNNDRTVPVFVVRHGREYLDGDGNVTPHPVRFMYATAQAVITTHEENI